MYIKTTATESINPGDIVLYKDCTEDPWRIGIYHHYNEKGSEGKKHYVVTRINFNNFNDDTPINNLLGIIYYRYVCKINIDKE